MMLCAVSHTKSESEKVKCNRLDLLSMSESYVFCFFCFEKNRSIYDIFVEFRSKRKSITTLLRLPLFSQYWKNLPSMRLNRADRKWEICPIKCFAIFFGQTQQSTHQFNRDAHYWNAHVFTNSFFFYLFCSNAISWMAKVIKHIFFVFVSSIFYLRSYIA